MGYQFIVNYDKSGELTPAEDRHIAKCIEDEVLDYFETEIPYNGDPFIMYNGFQEEFPYTFTIAANNWPNGTYPILMLKPGASLEDFKRGVKDVLYSLGFSKVRFRKSREMDLPHITFQR